MHPDSDAIRLAARQRQVLLSHGLRLHALEGIEPLQQPHGDIAGLGECELLAQTDPRPPVERQELPADLAALPALGPELQCVFSPDPFVQVTCTDCDINSGAFTNRDFFHRDAVDAYHWLRYG